MKKMLARSKLIVMRARSKLNSIEMLISQALIDSEISHEGYITVINEKRNTTERRYYDDESQKSDAEKD